MRGLLGGKTHPNWAVFKEWVIRVFRKDSPERISHFLSSVKLDSIFWKTPKKPFHLPRKVAL